MTAAIPEIWNIQVVAGDRFPALSFYVVDQDGTELTSFSVKCQIRKSYKSPTPVKELTEGSGFSVAGNLVTFDTSVSPLEANDGYIYDIEILPTGYTSPFTIYKGYITVLPQSTV